MLSLSPRFDLFRFEIPKDFIPEPIREKYAIILNQDKGVIQNPVDYLNESIQSVSIPGMDSLTIEQDQHSQRNVQGLHRFSNYTDVEPGRKNITYTVENPLYKIDNNIKISFRKNQGLYNYFMLYETILYKIGKENSDRYWKDDTTFHLDILNENGNVATSIIFDQPRIEGIEGMEFGFNKTERQVETFDLTIKYNNIHFEFLPNIKKEEA